jgi:hypothetical protein
MNQEVHSYVTLGFVGFILTSRQFIPILASEANIAPRDLYSSTGIIRTFRSGRMRWAEHVARMEDKTTAYTLFVGKPRGNRPLGKPRRRWMDNIKMDVVEIGWSCVDCIGLAQDRHS